MVAGTVALKYTKKATTSHLFFWFKPSSACSIRVNNQRQKTKLSYCQALFYDDDDDPGQARLSDGKPLQAHPEGLRLGKASSTVPINADSPVVEAPALRPIVPGEDCVLIV